jgi:hypothetical protein
LSRGDRKNYNKISAISSKDQSHQRP